MSNKLLSNKSRLSNLINQGKEAGVLEIIILLERISCAFALTIQLDIAIY